MIKGRLKLDIVQDGKIIGGFDDHNLITMSGKQLIAFLLTGEPGNNIITKIGVGDNNSLPVLSDTGLSNLYIKPVTGHTLLEQSVVQWHFSIDVDEANGMNISEFGLFSEGEQLFSRKIRSVAIPKDDSITLFGYWTVWVQECKKTTFSSSAYLDFAINDPNFYPKEYDSPVLLQDPPFGMSGSQRGMAIDDQFNLYTHNSTSNTIWKLDGMSNVILDSIGYPAGYTSWNLASITWNSGTNRLCLLMRESDSNIHWIELDGFTENIVLDIHLVQPSGLTQVNSMQVDTQRNLLVGVGVGWVSGYYNYLVVYNYPDGSLYNGGYHGKLIDHSNAMSYSILDIPNNHIWVVDPFVDDTDLRKYDYLETPGQGSTAQLDEIDFNSYTIGKYGIQLDPQGNMWMMGTETSGQFNNLCRRYDGISDILLP